MKSSNRILLWFAIAIASLLVITTVLVVTTGKRSEILLPEDTPQGAVQRYLLAVKDQDYRKAFSYLAPQYTIDYDNWRRSVAGAANSGWKASMGTTIITGSEATVEVEISVFRPAGPFEDPVRANRIAFSLKKLGNYWLITSPTDVWWLY
ncbi:MAG: hypothetical protein HYX81_05500 [Chloroflexi bacterium]|nr:hypothetical protein [Chloroflexota bacterium]